MRQTFKIAEILPNPFRHIEHYPIQRQKVDALKESIETTGFWDNIVARPANRKAEIAYGHHRLAALREVFGPSDEVQLIVRPLDDATMLKIMARENMEEWGSSVIVEHETIRAVVQAYSDGKIFLNEPPEITRRDSIRYAPSFIRGEDVGHPDILPKKTRTQFPYTAQTVAAFIGWIGPSGHAQDKVYDALSALELIERGILKERNFTGLSKTEASAVIRETRRSMELRARREREQRARAERARRQAEEAAARREEAERERKRRMEEAAKAARARDEEAKRRAKQEAERAKRERDEALQLELQAEKKRKAEQAKEQKMVDRSRRQASRIGGTLSHQFRTKDITARQARQVAMKIESEDEEPVVYAEIVAEKIATQVNRVLGPDQKLGQDVTELVRLRASLRETTRQNLATILDNVAARASNFARQFRGTDAKRISAP